MQTGPTTKKKKSHMPVGNNKDDDTAYPEQNGKTTDNELYDDKHGPLEEEMNESEEK